MLIRSMYIGMSFIFLLSSTAFGQSEFGDDSSILILDEGEQTISENTKVRMLTTPIVGINMDAGLTKSLENKLFKQLKASGVTLKDSGLRVGKTQGSSFANSGAVAAKNVSKAEREITRARSYLNSESFKNAKLVLERVSPLMGDNVAGLKNVKPLVDLYLAQAELALRQDELSVSDGYTRQAIVVDPSMKYFPKSLPPMFLGRIAMVQNQLLSERRGGIALSDGAKRHQVFIDGQDYGKTPIQINDVLPGRHVVRLVDESNNVWATVVDVLGNQVSSVSPETSDTIKSSGSLFSDNRMNDQGVSTMVKKAKSADYPGVLTGVATAIGPMIHVNFIYVDAGTGQISRLTQRRFDSDFLNLIIESGKLKAELVDRVVTKPFVAVDKRVINPDVKQKRVDMASVNFSYRDVVRLDIPTGVVAAQPKEAQTAKETPSRRLLDEEPQPQQPTQAEANAGRRLAGGPTPEPAAGGSGLSMRDFDNSDPFASGTSNVMLEEPMEEDDESEGMSSNKKKWLLIGGGVVVVTGAIIGGMYLNERYADVNSGQLNVLSFP